MRFRPSVLLCCYRDDDIHSLIDCSHRPFHHPIRSKKKILFEEELRANGINYHPIHYIQDTQTREIHRSYPSTEKAGFSDKQLHII